MLLRFFSKSTFSLRVPRNPCIFIPPHSDGTNTGTDADTADWLPSNAHEVSLLGAPNRLPQLGLSWAPALLVHGLFHWVFLPLETPGILHWPAAPCRLEGLGIFPFLTPLCWVALCVQGRVPLTASPKHSSFLPRNSPQPLWDRD